MSTCSTWVSLVVWCICSSTQERDPQVGLSKEKSVDVDMVSDRGVEGIALDVSNILTGEVGVTLVSM